MAKSNLAELVSIAEKGVAYASVLNQVRNVQVDSLSNAKRMLNDPSLSPGKNPNPQGRTRGVMRYR